MDVLALYAQRFDAAERAAKARLWDTLCRHFLQRYVAADSTVLDLGAAGGDREARREGLGCAGRLVHNSNRWRRARG